jgi:hypothetical protein
VSGRFVFDDHPPFWWLLPIVDSGLHVIHIERAHFFQSEDL